MLAEAMVRLQRGKPDRKYAVDPRLTEYLQTASRAFGVPRLLRVLLPHLSGTGRGVDVFRSLIDSLHLGGDPAAPGAALDLFQELSGRQFHSDPVNLHGGQPFHGDLLHVLDGLHRAATGGVAPEMFSDDNLERVFNQTRAVDLSHPGELAHAHGRLFNSQRGMSPLMLGIGNDLQRRAGMLNRGAVTGLGGAGFVRLLNQIHNDIEATGHGNTAVELRPNVLRSADTASHATESLMREHLGRLFEGVNNAR